MNDDTVEWTDASYGHRRAMATCRQTGAQVVGQWRLGAVLDADRNAARDALAVLTGRASVCAGTRDCSCAGHRASAAVRCSCRSGHPTRALIKNWRPT